MVSRRYVLTRTAQAAFSIWAAITIAFALVRLMPGSPVDALKSQLQQANPALSDEEVNRMVEAYISVQPDQPLYIQYIEYMTNILLGDLGTTQIGNQPVIEIVTYAVPWTLFFTTISLFLIYLIGLSLGSAIAYVEGSKHDQIMSTISIIVSAVPYYILAALMIWFLAHEWGLFPYSGRVNTELEPGIYYTYIHSVFYHATLPILSLVVTGFGIVALAMRGNCIQVLGDDFVRVSQLRGIPTLSIAINYVGRNAVLPLYTSMMIAIGTIFGGAIILEEMFVYPGMGYYMFRAIVSRDYPLLMGTFLFIVTGVIIAVYIADLTYGLIDPRAGSEDRGETYGGIGSKGIVTTLWQIAKRKSRQVFSTSTDNITDESFSIGHVESPDVSASQSSGSSTRKKELKQSIKEWIIAPLLILWSDWRARIGGLIILAFLLTSTVGVYIVDSPSTFDGPPLEGPFQGWENPLGTDGSGNSILGLLVHAAPAMLKMIVGGTTFAITLATIWGMVAGYIGGAIDRAMMTFADVLIAIPGLPLVIVLAVMIDPGNPYLVGVILSVNAWAGLARALRSQVLTTRQETYIEASRVMGLSTGGIITRDVLPNLMPLILVNAVLQARNIIFGSVALYFLGVLPFTNLNWGVMLNFAYQSPASMYSWHTAHWFLSPMTTIVILTLGLILFGQACDQIFNPRLRARHIDMDEAEIVEDVEETQVDYAQM